MKNKYNARGSSDDDLFCLCNLHKNINGFSLHYPLENFNNVLTMGVHCGIIKT